MARVAVGLLALFAGVCAAQDSGPRAESKAALDAAPACCTVLGDFGFQRFPVNFPEKFPIGRDGRAYRFGSGRSFFLAFELPKYESVYHVSVSTWITGKDEGMSIFCPAILLTDSAYRPVARYTDLAYRGASPTTRYGKPGMEARFVIDERTRAARYIFFLTDPGLASRSRKFKRMPGMLPGGLMTAGDTFEVPCSYEGELGLHITAKYGPEPGGQPDAK